MRYTRVEGLPEDGQIEAETSSVYFMQLNILIYIYIYNEQSCAVWLF